MKFKVDFQGFDKLINDVKKLSDVDISKASRVFCEETIRELAADLLSKVIEKTPVGQYGSKQVNFLTKDGEEVSFLARSHKTGGTLKRGWSVGGVQKNGSVYTVELINPVYYAPYVEYGHRTRERVDGSRGWVEGKFMLTLSEADLQEDAPGIIERKLTEFMEDLTNGNFR